MDKRGRVVISVVVLFVLLASLSTYFVLATETNTKSYDSTTKTVTISYQNNPIGTVTLLDNSYYCNSYCYAILKVNTSISKQIFDVDPSVIGEVNFLKKVGVSWLPDSLSYDILVGKKRILIQEVNGNSTSYNISKEIIDWVPLKDSQISNGQEFYIKIEGYKDSKKDVDWVLNLFGLDLNEFAQWNYMKEYSDDFSDASINTTLWTYTGGTTEGIGNISTGGSSLSYYVTNFDFNTSTSWKITFNMSYILSGNEHWIGICNEKTLDWTKLAGGTACTLIAPVGIYYTNIIGMSKLQYYIIINGTNRVISLYNWDGTVNSTGAYTFTNMYLAFGTNNAAEMMLYDFNVYQLGEPQDNPPTITLNSPENYANFSANPVAFNCTAQDDNMIQNVSLWINGEINYTLTDGTDNYTELYIERTLGDGIYNWTCSAYDNATATSQIGWGINRTLMIDTTPPQTTTPIITPSNPISSNNLQCSATLTDNLQTNLTAYWRWYKNGIDYLNGNTSVTNGISSLIATLSSGNLSQGDNWVCEVKPFNGYRNGTALNSSIVEIGWAITFNVTDSYYGTGLNNVLISCNQTGFSQLGDTTNPYGPYGFPDGNWECTFTPDQHYPKIIIFTADNDTIINVPISEKAQITVEEHTWLEAIYNCLYSGDCSLYNQLLQINQTVNNISQTVNQNSILIQALNNCMINGDCTLYNTLMNVNQTVNQNNLLTQAIYQCVNLGNCTLYNIIMQINNNTINGLQEHTWLQAIYDCTSTGNCTLYNNLYASLVKINQTLVNIWQRLTGTDRSVVLQENITSYYLSPSSSIEVNYTIKIPYKEGVPINELLPIRLYFWFTDANKTSCYNQDKGDSAKENIAEYPYCLPLMAETLGPNNGTKTFKVSLRPDLATGTYNIIRSIEIDPLGVWTQYGREDIGQIGVLNSGDASIEISNENSINSAFSSSSNQQQSSSSSGSDSSSTSKKVTNIYNNYYTTENGGTGESQTPSGDGVIHLNKPTGITGGIIGIVSNLLSGWQITFIIITLCITFIIFVLIKSNIIKIKR